MHIQSIQNPFRISKGIFCFYLLLVSFAATAQPKAEWKTTKVEFKDVQRGEVLNFDFVVTNTGNAPLVLQEGEVSCSCTSVDYSSKPILPGQSATVTVVFNTKTVYGRQDRIVKFYSNASEKPVNLRYKGYVIYKK